MLNQLEIKIEKNSETGNFRATALEFPNCEGLGSSQALAIKALGKSIVKILNRSIEEMVNALLFKNDFTEIVLDATESKTIQKRVYSLDARAKKITKSMSIKLDKFSTGESDKTNLADLMNMIQKETVSVNHLLKSQQKDESAMIQTLEQLLPSDDVEGFAFGFPISFN